MRKPLNVVSALGYLGRGHMAWIRNLLISFGIFWLSLWLVVPLAWLFGKVNSRIIYGDSVLDAVAMGVMTSMGQAVAAALAGVAATLAIGSPKSQRWSLVIAALYVAYAPWRSHWYISPTWWDHVGQVVHVLAPALFCIAFAAVTAHITNGSNSSITGDPKPRHRAVEWAIRSFWKHGAGICVALAFLPLAITVRGIYGESTIDLSTGWGVLFNPITLAALFWLGATSVYYRRTRSKRAAWIFGLFPLAFAEPALIVYVWMWTQHPLK
jgi:hypothetical protein